MSSKSVKLVVLNDDNKKYFTGRCWEKEYSTDICEAKTFDNLEEIQGYIDDENDRGGEIMREANLLKVETIFV